MIDRCPICLDEIGAHFHPTPCKCSKGRKEDAPMLKGKTQLEVYSEVFDYLLFKFKDKKYDEYVILSNRDVIMEIWSKTLDATFQEFMQEVIPMANDDGKIVMNNPKVMCEEIINPTQDQEDTDVTEYDCGILINCKKDDAPSFVFEKVVKELNIEKQLDEELKELMPDAVEFTLAGNEEISVVHEVKKKRGRPKSKG